MDSLYTHDLADRAIQPRATSSSLTAVGAWQIERSRNLFYNGYPYDALRKTVCNVTIRYEVEIRVHILPKMVWMVTLALQLKYHRNGSED